MSYTPKTIKKALKNCLNELSLHPEVFSKHPGRDFTRTRKLPFMQTVKTILSMTGKSLRGELMDYFDLVPSMPTVSAFVQQRNKINYSAFETLFHSFTNSVDEQKTFKGYRLLAVDGSDLHVPTNRKETQSFYQNAKEHKPFNILHLNALYDLERQIYTDAVVQPLKHRNEHKAFTSMIDRDDSSIPTIYIADRGFESYNNMAHVIEKQQKFLFRIKDLGKSGIASGLAIQDTGEFDKSISIGLTRQQTKEVKKSNLKFIPHSTTFDFLPKTSKKSVPMSPYYFSFRVVRFKLTETTYELLVTNLTEDEFDITDLKQLYAMRWGIETSFRDLKYSLSLSLFHSKKTEYILQEVFAKLTMYNFVQLITSHVAVKHKHTKHPYRINFAAAVHICRSFFLKNISPSLIETLLLQHILPIRQRPASPRNSHARAAASFSYRIP